MTTLGTLVLPCPGGDLWSMHGEHFDGVGRSGNALDQFLGLLAGGATGAEDLDFLDHGRLLGQTRSNVGSSLTGGSR